MQAIIVEGSLQEISDFVKSLGKGKNTYELEMELFEKTHHGHKSTIFSSDEEAGTT